MKKNLTALVATLVLLIAGACFSYAAFPVANNAPATETTIGSSENHNTVQAQENYSENVELTKASAPAKAGSGGKSQLVALLLCLIVGGLGIHRFYLGYTWQGVVQLLTGGGCGIWALIDLIRIIIGDLGPKGGSYAKTL